MEWSERLNSAIDYIEKNLAKKIDTEVAAKKALCSDSHFQRMFNVVTGITLGEYIRRRRLTLAAAELASGNIKVMDVALKYGYDSPEAFTRAFRHVHGVSPQAARIQGIALHSYPRISFHINMIGGTDISYKIIQKPAFDAVGIVKKFTSAEGTAPAQFWVDFRQTTDSSVLHNLNHGELGPVTGGLALGVVFNINKDDFKYGIAVEKIGGVIPDGFEMIHLPASTWAVFDVFGMMPDALWQADRRIYGEWLHSTGYESSAGIKLEVYLSGNHNQKWVPIKTKKNHFSFSATTSTLAPSIFRGSLSGNWAAGSFSAPGNGTFSMTVDSNGIVQGSFKGDYSGIIEGQVDLDGNVNAIGTSISGSSTSIVITIVGRLITSGSTISIFGNFKINEHWLYFTGTGNVSSVEYYFPNRVKVKRILK